ncbi:monocarboxylate transporter 14-like isoform X1 [Haliotis rufescens]|uniref:monocarboxylate transporter 14-like isoform X1 n=1 Tax=Haliotis rufescens TaxID=6454 RepID=UPI00201F7126|nr:monocarboxylate transporter 14-like isoform X1 [Haliotis rufescens]XP_046349361.2 monocarboxylate transporter 14-like isoform X1 [Haliotis rufescens]XP_048247141.1 monocarboxylate transporter 14-like isoform X1 [Haliotis rufescens]
MEVSKANVDRGYAWVILSAAFTLQFMAGILAYSPGVMNIAVLEEIENDLTKTSWIGSINFGACTLLGPVAGLIQSKAGSRITAMVGGALTLIGMTVASFCKSIFGLVLTYGLVSGFGICLACNVVGVVTGQYFSKRQATAFGVCIAGGGMGLFVAGPLVRYLLSQYNLSGALLILGAIEFHMCVAGVVLRPLKQSQSSTVVNIDQSVDDSTDKDQECAPHISRKASHLLHSKSTEKKFASIQPQPSEENTHNDQTLEISTSADDPLSYHAFISSPQEDTKKSRIKSNICHVFSAFRVLKEIRFLIYNLSIMLWTLGESAAVFHLPYYAQQKGSSPDQAATLFTAMGVGSVFSRVVAGMMASDSKIPYMVLQVGFTGISGVLLMLFPLYSHTYNTQMVFGILYGTYSQGMNTLIGPIVLDLVTLKDVPVAYGFVYYSMGVGYILGPPVASWIFRLSMVYDFTYVFAGTCLIFSSISAALVSVVGRKVMQGPIQTKTGMAS